MKNNKKDDTKGYISNYLRVIEAQYNYIQGLTEDLHPDNHRFISHLIVSTRNKNKEEATERWTPVWWKLIQKEIPDLDWKTLESKGMIQVKDHDRNKGKSRRFQLNKDIFITFSDLGPQPGDDLTSYQWVNLFSGKQSRMARGNQRHEGSNKEPNLIAEAMECLHTGYFNKTEVEEYLISLKASVGASSPKYLQALGCYQCILKQNPKKSETPHIYTFTNSYVAAYTGRIYFDGGGLQNAPKAMKAAAYSGIENIHNYDLVSSQMNALLIELRGLEIDTSWIDQYLSNPKAKEVYSKAVGVGQDLWKEMLYSLLFGASVRKEEGCSIYDLVVEGFGEGEDAEDVYYRFKEVTRGLAKACEKWHQYLYETYFIYSKQAFIYNKVGKSLKRVDIEAESTSKAKRTLAAFFLQGRESAFIQELTCLSKDYGYQVIANEHDGIVTIGQIAEEAVRKASGKSGFYTAQLIQKAFNN